MPAIDQIDMLIAYCADEVECGDPLVCLDPAAELLDNASVLVLAIDSADIGQQIASSPQCLHALLAACRSSGVKTALVGSRPCRQALLLQLAAQSPDEAQGTLLEGVPEGLRPVLLRMLADFLLPSSTPSGVAEDDLICGSLTLAQLLLVEGQRQGQGQVGGQQCFVQAERLLAPLRRCSDDGLWAEVTHARARGYHLLGRRQDALDVYRGYLSSLGYDLLGDGAAAADADDFALRALNPRPAQLLCAALIKICKLGLLEDRAAAEAVLDHAISLHDMHLVGGALTYPLALQCKRMARYQQALQLLRTLAQEEADKEAVQYTTARLHDLLGEHVEAMDQYERCLLLLTGAAHRAAACQRLLALYQLQPLDAESAGALVSRLLSLQNSMPLCAEAAGLLTGYARHLTDRGLWAQALSLHERIFDMRQQQQQNEQGQAQEQVHGQGVYWHKLAVQAEKAAAMHVAIDCYCRYYTLALLSQQQQQPSADVDTQALAAVQTVAVLYEGLDLQAEALEAFELSVSIRLRLLGRAHPLTLKAVLALIGYHRRQDDSLRAIGCCERYLDMHPHDAEADEEVLAVLAMHAHLLDGQLLLAEDSASAADKQHVIVRYEAYLSAARSSRCAPSEEVLQATHRLATLHYRGGAYQLAAASYKVLCAHAADAEQRGAAAYQRALCLHHLGDLRGAEGLYWHLLGGAMGEGVRQEEVDEVDLLALPALSPCCPKPMSLSPWVSPSLRNLLGIYQKQGRVRAAACAQHALCRLLSKEEDKGDAHREAAHALGLMLVKLAAAAEDMDDAMDGGSDMDLGDGCGDAAMFLNKDSGKTMLSTAPCTPNPCPSDPPASALAPAVPSAPAPVVTDDTPCISLLALSERCFRLSLAGQLYPNTTALQSIGAAYLQYGHLRAASRWYLQALRSAEPATDDRLSCLLALLGASRALRRMHVADQCCGQLTALYAQRYGARDAHTLRSALTHGHMLVQQLGDLLRGLRAYTRCRDCNPLHALLRKCYDTGSACTPEEVQAAMSDGDAAHYLFLLIEGVFNVGRVLQRKAGAEAEAGGEGTEDCYRYALHCIHTYRSITHGEDSDPSPEESKDKDSERDREDLFNIVIQHLAALCFQQGGYPEAEALYQQVYDHRLHKLGSAHPAMCAAANDLGSACTANGKLAEALALYEMVHSVRCAAHGHLHYDTLVSLLNLAYLYQRMQEHTLASERYELCLLHGQQLLDEQEQEQGSSSGQVQALLDKVRAKQATLEGDRVAMVRRASKLSVGQGVPGDQQVTGGCCVVS